MTSSTKILTQALTDKTRGSAPIATPDMYTTDTQKTGTQRATRPSFFRLLSSGLMILITALFLAACGVTPEPTPIPEPTATTEPEAEIVEPTPTPIDEGEAAAETPSVPNGTATRTPLVVDESPTDCEIESNLDLAGYMDIEERMGCARDIAKFDPVAINEFGDGPDFNRFMLWFGSEGNIYVLLPDGTYDVYPDEWQESDPTFTCNPLESEADSPPLPRRGFGKVWCEQPELQEILGFVEREERLCQHAVDQPFESGRLVACFEDASVRYFRILYDGTWDVTLQ